MAAASIANSCSADFDVFLSHRGPDTKKSFSAWLKAELEKQHIRAFLDYQSLKVGETARTKMDEAMRIAQWGIIILSPTFFASGHCMEELKRFLARDRALILGFELKAADCSPDAIVRRAEGSIWEQHGGKLWERCSTFGRIWSEPEWREVIHGARNAELFLQLDDFSCWDDCISDVVALAADKLGRSTVVWNGKVDMAPDLPMPAFRGRETALLEIKKVLETGFRWVCISGGAGIGKTQLVLKFVQEQSREFKKILWVDAGAGNLRNGYLDLARHLAVEMDRPFEPTTRDPVIQIRQALGSLCRRNLLVFDNVDDETELSTLLPEEGPCAVVVTTRLNGLEGFSTIELGMLAQEDALDLLRGGHIFNQEEEQALQELAEGLNYRTAALVAAARRLVEHDDFPSDLLSDLTMHGPGLFTE